MLLVAAGIASYADAPPAGSAMHGTLYTDEIQSKTSETVTFKTNLAINGLIMGIGGIPLTVNGDAGYGNTKGIESSFRGNGPAIEGTTSGSAGGVGVKGISTNSNTAVEGTNTPSATTGKLGTSVAGVEGTTDSATQFGVYGKQSAGGFAVKGKNTDSGNYGEIGGVSTGVKGYGSSYGVQGGTGLSGLVGVDGFTSNPAGYAGRFTGGKGLYASKIEFGTSAFSATGNSGSLIIGAAGVVACSTVCTAHGLGCLAAYTLTGTNPAYNCGVPPSGAIRYCWCGSA